MKKQVKRRIIEGLEPFLIISLAVLLLVIALVWYQSTGNLTEYSALGNTASNHTTSTGYTFFDSLLQKITGLPKLEIQNTGKTYFVMQNGSGNFTTIQACADAAVAGDICTVYPGTYPEHMITKSGGTDESHRVKFIANGLVTMQGFDIENPYVTVVGFDITGYQAQYDGNILINYQGNFSQIFNNTIRDGAPNVYGIFFYFSYADFSQANNCTVSGNILTNLSDHFFAVGGSNNLIENNILENLNGYDAIRFGGHDNIFRHNIVRNSVTAPGNENHPDFVQTFANNGGESYNMLFEENWIENLDGQMGQLTNDAPAGTLTPNPNFHDLVFRNNVFLNISDNFNIEFPGVHFEHNTFYHVAYELSGLFFVSSLNRGESPRGLVKSNAFVGSGESDRSGSGYYYMTGAGLSQTVVGIAINNTDDAEGVYNNLINNGYVLNGGLGSAAFNLTDISNFTISAQYAGYKSAVYDLLQNAVAQDRNVRETFTADYNFVAGYAPNFSSKPTTDCSKTYPDYVFDFCEQHGVNGGDPLYQNISNPLGPDGIPFTLDDGLKPVPGSPLCNAGENGLDIGAYSCNVSTVFTNSSDTDTFPQTYYQLSVTKAGNGSGTVTGNGINCGSTCSASATPGTSISLSASPSSGSAFSGWTGTCSGTGTCSFTITSNTAVTATFVLNQTSQSEQETNNPSNTGGGGGGTTTTTTNMTNRSGAGGTGQVGQPTETAGSQGSGSAGKISSSILTYLISFLVIAIVAVIIKIVIIKRRQRAARLKKEMFDRAAANFSNLTNQELVE